MDQRKWISINVKKLLRVIFSPFCYSKSNRILCFALINNKKIRTNLSQSISFVTWICRVQNINMLLVQPENYTRAVYFFPIINIEMNLKLLLNSNHQLYRKYYSNKL